MSCSNCSQNDSSILLVPCHHCICQHCFQENTCPNCTFKYTSIIKMKTSSAVSRQAMDAILLTERKEKEKIIRKLNETILKLEKK